MAKKVKKYDKQVWLWVMCGGAIVLLLAILMQQSQLLKGQLYQVSEPVPSGGTVIASPETTEVALAPRVSVCRCFISEEKVEMSDEEKVLVALERSSRDNLCAVPWTITEDVFLEGENAVCKDELVELGDGKNCAQHNGKTVDVHLLDSRPVFGGFYNLGKDKYEYFSRLVPDGGYLFNCKESQIEPLSAGAAL